MSHYAETDLVIGFDKDNKPLKIKTPKDNLVFEDGVVRWVLYSCYNETFEQFTNED